MTNALTTLQRQFEPLAPRFAAALSAPGVQVNANQLIMSVITSVEHNPALLECNRQSLIQAAMSAAWLGLPCDGVTGQSFIIPFKGRAQLVVGYKGLNTLAARSGITITASVVRAFDDFDFDEGRAVVSHKKRLDKTDESIIAVWAKAASNDRPAIVKVMSIADILAVKARSPGAQRKESPWNDPNIGFPAMAEKTAMRRLARSLPLNVMTIAARMEEAHEEEGKHAWITSDSTLQIEATREGAEQPSAAELAAPLMTLEEAEAKLGKAAEYGMTVLEAAWLATPREHKTALKTALDSRFKPRAMAQDRGESEDSAP